MKRLIPLALLLVGCQAPLTEGVITSKSYEPPYTYTTYDCVVYGKYGCQVAVPNQHHVSERFVINMRGKNKDGETQLDYFYVDSAEYQRIEIGQHYRRSLD